MAQWSRETPPNWRVKNGNKAPVATERGWEDPDSGELLVAISNLATKAEEANILEVGFGADAYEQSDPLTVVVRFNEKVNVTAGATLVVTSTGVSGNVTLTAAAQTEVNEVVFSGTVPGEAATLSIAAQSVVGTIVDAAKVASASDKSISAEIAAAAGTRVVA
jgi:hypothetical protein